ncbi:hypothetical protein CDEST_05215 [Colletotrichum destructivum]|uniref:Uncharacterized protein n=1 Tax=Colletotrichum destructivum TaxID=34406 RepID=A0AAX4IB12_9PEZI|nr:hypothetical protein CDEST_05215 [Colletotrichum destructivum]
MNMSCTFRLSKFYLARGGIDAFDGRTDGNCQAGPPTSMLTEGGKSVSLLMNQSRPRGFCRVPTVQQVPTKYELEEQKTRPVQTDVNKSMEKDHGTIWMGGRLPFDNLSLS